MKNNLLILLVICLLFSSCGQPIVYNGDKYPKTKTVEIYYSTKDVKRPYKVIGHIKSHKYSDNIMKLELTHFGKSIGADAVIVLGVDSTGKANHINADAIKFN